MTTYTQVFGGTNIYPADVSYLAFNLNGSDVYLTWPTETNAPASGALISARIMDVNCTTAGRYVYLPSANEASVGECLLFNNVGSQSFYVVDSIGGAVATVAPGTLWQVYMTGNSSAAGTWYAYQFGSSLSIANAAALAGLGLKAITSTLNQALSVNGLNSDYTVGVSDRAKVFNWTGASGTISFTTAPVLGNDWFCYVRNSGSSAITLSPNGSETINGAFTLTMNPGDSAAVICDGVNLFTIGLGKSATFTFDYTQIDVSGSGTYTLAGFELNRIAYDFIGALTGNRDIEVPATVQQYWVTNNTTGSYDLSVTASGGLGVIVPQGGAAILYCNGTDVVNAQTLNVALPVPISDGGTGATTANGALINLGGTSVGIGLFTATDAAAARTDIDVFSTDETTSLIVAMS
jgi:hypothetical protein